MTNEEYIKKWLDGSLSEAEQEAFMATEEYKSLKKMSAALLAFKAPDYDVESELEQLKAKILDELTIQAERLPVSESDIISLDWINGRRTPDVNPLLKGAITSISIGTNAPLIYKSLVESICFGAKKIVDRFLSEGLEVKSIVGIGGVANKSSFIMQTLADILNMPIKVVASQQTGGLGAAMFAAVAGKIYPSIAEAIEHMGHGFKQTYYPNQEHVPIYEKLYEKYSELGDFVESKTQAIHH